MRFKIILAIALILCVFCVIPVNADLNNWTMISNNSIVTDKANACSVVFDNKIWVIGGYTGNSLTNDVWYSVDGVSWIQATANAGFEPRADFAAWVYNGKIYIGGGEYSRGFLNDVWSSSDGVTWERLTGFSSWYYRSEVMFWVYDNKMWIAGGRLNNDRYFNDCYYSTDGATWTRFNNVPWSARCGAISAVYNNKMYMIGGQTYNSNYQIDNYYNEVWSFDGTTWTNEGVLPYQPRIYSNGIGLNDNLMVFGGYDFSSSMLLNDIWLYNGVSWSRLTNNAEVTQRASYNIEEYNNALYIFGGYHIGDVYKCDLGQNIIIASDNKGLSNNIDNNLIIGQDLIVTNYYHNNINYAGLCDGGQINKIEYNVYDSTNQLSYKASYTNNNGNWIKTISFDGANFVNINENIGNEYPYQFNVNLIDELGLHSIEITYTITTSQNVVELVMLDRMQFNINPYSNSYNLYLSNYNQKTGIQTNKYETGDGVKIVINNYNEFVNSLLSNEDVYSISYILTETNSNKIYTWTNYQKIRNGNWQWIDYYFTGKQISNPIYEDLGTNEIDISKISMGLLNEGNYKIAVSITIAQYNSINTNDLNVNGFRTISLDGNTITVNPSTNYYKDMRIILQDISSSSNIIGGYVDIYYYNYLTDSITLYKHINNNNGIIDFSYDSLQPLFISTDINGYIPINQEYYTTLNKYGLKLIYNSDSVVLRFRQENVLLQIDQSFVIVDSNTNSELKDVKVTLNPNSDNKIKYSNQLGIVVFNNITEGKNSFIFELNGYNPSILNMNVSVSNTQIIELTKIITGQETTSPTVKPTAYPTDSEGNIIIEKPSNIMESVTFGFAKIFGIKTGENANYIFALMLILFPAVIAGSITRQALGFIAGGMVGFVFALAVGLVPIWVFFAMCLMAVIFLVLKGGNEGF